MGKQLEFLFEKEDDVDFSKLFSIMPSKDLAEEFFAYEKQDLNSKEYVALVNEISKRKNNKDSVTKWAKKFEMNKTKKNDLEFYNLLNEKGISPSNGDVFYLRGAITDVYNYRNLWGGSNRVKHNGNVMKKGYKTKLENADPQQIRSFSMERYSKGQELSELFKR